MEIKGYEMMMRKRGKERKGKEGGEDEGGEGG